MDSPTLRPILFLREFSFHQSSPELLLLPFLLSLLVENACVVGRDEPLGIMFIDTHPPTLLFEITAIVFGHPDVRFEKVGESVEGCRHWIDDDVGGFVEE